LALW
jgi:hypothetical protein